MHEEDRQAERDAQQHERTGNAPPKLISGFRHERQHVPYEHDGDGQLQEHRREKTGVVLGLQAHVEHDAMRRNLPETLEYLSRGKPNELREEDRNDIA